jgi:hypothetical protein
MEVLVNGAPAVPWASVPKRRDLATRQLDGENGSAMSEDIRFIGY